MIIFVYLFVFLTIFLLIYSLLSMYREIADSDIINVFEEKKDEREGITKLWLAFARIVGDFLASIFIPPTEDVEVKQPRGYRGLMKKLDQQLVIAGRPYGIVPNEIVGSMFIASFLGICAGLYIGYFTDYLIEAAVCLGLLFFALPMMWLNDKRKKRQTIIFRTLPYAIDLMTLGVEAGMDFTVALRKISEKLKRNPLGEEFIQVVSEINLGKNRSDSLKDMANRVKIDDLLSFVNSIIQADELGSSMGPVMRIQSSQLRIKRSQIAEEKAMKAPVKLIFPLVFVFLPAVLMLLLGIIFIGKILPMMKGG